jgi:two-component sensor histidine kinase
LESDSVAETMAKLDEQAALLRVGAVIGSTLSLTDKLNRIAGEMGQAVDVTGTRICSWEPETRSSAVLAQYVNSRAGAAQQAQNPGVPPVESDPTFLATLLAGRPWVHHLEGVDSAPDGPDHRPQQESQTRLFVPLQTGDRIIGFAELWESRRCRQFTPEEIGLCHAISQIAAVAIDNARLHEQLQRELEKHRQTEEALRRLQESLEDQIAERTAELNRINAELVREVHSRSQNEDWLLQRNRELLSLQSAAAATTASLDLQFVLETVTWEMASLLQVESCVIYQWNAETGLLSSIAEYDATGESDGLTNQDHRLADYPLRQRVLHERYAQQMTVSQPDLDLAERTHMQEAGAKTLLILPMVFQDRVVGLAEMRDSQVERTLTDHQVSLAQFLTTQAASAMENARLYRRAQQEIAERMRAEEQIKASLKEKEVLLKEIHHRVKNNLQIVSSLLHLQSQYIKDQPALDVLVESQNRIRSMALIHERLYRSQDLASIDFAVYIQDLTTHLIRSYRARPAPIDLKIDAQDVYLAVDTAIPCGLITNELISNALKHAFPDGKAGEIRIKMELEGDRQFTLIVGDNGVGFPPDVDFENTESLGMQLVNTLVNQLDGTIELHSDDEGAEFRITFVVP